MKEFWDERYREKDYAYGEAPNVFFRDQIQRLKPGSILLPADGEGRNGVFAAGLGWDVTSFDYSTLARDKALALAERKSVKIEYIVGAFEEMEFLPEKFDVVALIFAHFPPNVRRDYHRRAMNWLRPGGTVILEAFNPQNLEFLRVNPKVGGPSNVDLLYTAEMLEDDFKGMDLQCAEETIATLSEGNYHVGQAAVVRLVARKPI